MRNLDLLKLYCTEIPLRLQGPSRANGTGRLEIFYEGEWGTICDDSWNLNDANVACRQLGYKFAVRALQSNQVNAGSGRIWLGSVQCFGNEQNLTECFHRGWGSYSCNHSGDIGVECSSTGIL